MSTLVSLLQQPPAMRAGWALIHFLWQGSVIAIALAVLRGAAGNRLGARARYGLSCLALGLMAAAPPLTLLFLWRAEADPLPGPVWRIGGGWERVLPWIVLAWALGAAMCSARVAMGWRRAARLRRLAVEAPPPEWQEALNRLIQRMRVSAPVRLAASPLAAAPAVVGWLKPVILMPVEAVLGMPLSQVQALLAHELAHVRRNDYLVNILQSIAEALLFYHPAVWWVSGQIRAERELCCDDLAVEASGDVLTYATALATLETARRARPQAAMAADGGSLLARIRRLAGQSETTHSLPGPGAAWALALLWVVGAGAVAMQAGQSPAAPALRLFAAPGIAAAPPVSAVPPRVSASRAALVSALLFDPFFASPQSATAAPASSDAAEQEKKLASVSGTALTTSGKPVANATVRLSPSNAGSAVYVTSATQTALMSSPQSVAITRTDAEGKFSLKRVSPGSYTLQFEHKDYLPSVYGARPGLAAGNVITLDEGRNVTDLVVKLPEPATFTGKVVDDDGDPVAQIMVAAQVKRFFYPRMSGEIVASATSAENGEFRLTVPAGRYVLLAMKRPTWTTAERAPIPAAKPGQKVLAQHGTCWGDAGDYGKCAQVEIGPGQVLPLGNFRLKSIPTVHVRGKVTGDPALLKGARVLRVPPPNDAMGWSLGADIQPDGSFDMANMWPDTFTIAAYGSRGYMGWADIVVGDEDLDKVQINAVSMPLTGIVTVEGADAAQPPPTSEPAAASTANSLTVVNGVLVTAPQAGGAAPGMPARIELTSAGYYKVSSTAQVRPDGTFMFNSVPPGAYVLNLPGMPRDAYVKSARQDSRDVLRENLDWGGNNGPLEIVVSRKAPVLDGSVTDADGNALPGTVTLVADPERPGHPLLYPTARADQNGKFRFQSVAPGSYRIFAWQSVPDGAHSVPDFIDAFMGAGERLELKEGDHKTMTVKRISVDTMDSTLRRAGK
jgi:beta-lactamase regulating signal transducer with metallopeptidase domain/protocatechuate 3,4-dioxygenase beta subunit